MQILYTNNSSYSHTPSLQSPLLYKHPVGPLFQAETALSPTSANGILKVGKAIWNFLAKAIPSRETAKSTVYPPTWAKLTGWLAFLDGIGTIPPGVITNNTPLIQSGAISTVLLASVAVVLKMYRLDRQIFQRTVPTITFQAC